jgi:hypothetical protein
MTQRKKMNKITDEVIYWPVCCGQEMEFDPALWETEEIVEFHCSYCNRTARGISKDKNRE